MIWLLGSINWEAVGVIISFITVSVGGLYVALRNFKGDIKVTITDSVQEVEDKVDLVGDHLKLQDAELADTNTRLAHVEGHLGINGFRRP